MKNKKTYIAFGLILLIIAFFVPQVGLFVVKSSHGVFSVEDLSLYVISVAVLFLGFSEKFFIKSGIVPKWLRYIIYWQWISVPIILIPGWIEKIFD